MKKNVINPIELKGKEKIYRMRELMGESVQKDQKNYVIELTKNGPDGKVYAIVRENHQYFIKVTDKTENIVAEDFKYVGGLQNKTDLAYPSYSRAIKQLNLKFINLNEAYNKTDKINVFENDNAIGAASQGFAPKTVFEDEESLTEVEDINGGDAEQDGKKEDLGGGFDEKKAYASDAKKHIVKEEDDEPEDEDGEEVKFDKTGAYDPKKHGKLVSPFSGDRHGKDVVDPKQQRAGDDVTRKVDEDIKVENFRMKISNAISETVKKKV